jgi:methylmalonyl-CoA mutase cobalamin-binding subunit
VLLQASNDFSPRQLVTAVLAPALEQVGERWASGELCTASEHAASALLRTQLGALLVAVLIAMRGCRAVYLGANLPAQQIVEAARLSRASAVALSIVNLAPDDAERQLTALCQALPRKVEVLLGGRGVPPAQQLPARARLLSSLEDLERWLDVVGD